MIGEHDEHPIEDRSLIVVEAERACGDRRDRRAPETAREPCGVGAGERRGEQRDQPAAAADDQIGPGVVAIRIGGRRDRDDQRHHVERFRLVREGTRDHGGRERDARPADRVRGQEAGPQQLGDVLEPRPGLGEHDCEVTAIGRPLWRDRRDRRVEHRLAPAQRTRRHRAMSGAGIAAHAQALEVRERVQPPSSPRAGDRPHLTAADVRVQRADLDPEMARRGRRVEPTLIVDSTLINHTDSRITSIERGTMKPTSSGLDDVNVADTAISDVDGERGKLTLAGLDVEQIARSDSFEQAAARVLGAGAEAAIEPLVTAPARLAAWEVVPRLGDALDHPDGMDALRTALGHLRTTGDDLADARAAIGAAPVFVAAWNRKRTGQAAVARIQRSVTPRIISRCRSAWHRRPRRSPGWMRTWSRSSITR
ncbi:MAG: citrate/2-methylcitrate synthase [Kofleriaceae bacterium]